MEAVQAMHTVLAKFDQNSYLRRVFLITGENILMEEKPDDTIWGVGLYAKNPKIFIHQGRLPEKKSTWGLPHVSAIGFDVRVNAHFGRH